MNQFSRRDFLKNSALAGMALSLPARVRAAAPGANDDIRIAVVGFNGRGQDHLANLTKLKGVRVVALCDVDKKVLDKGVETLKTKNDLDVTGYTDIRKLLESKEIDAVSIATPNHWHSLATIWACQAGKDVYVEKPVSHNIWEGRQMVAASKKYNRIVQAGTQCRSGAAIAECIEWMKRGEMGKITVARGLCYKPRPSIGKSDAPVTIPEGVDFDLWCGPAPKVAPVRKKLHYDWHWFWDTGNGDLGNQGVHQMDVARWFLGEDLPNSTFCIGGRLGYVDDGQTPNTQLIYHDYKKAPMIFEVRGLPEKAGSKDMDKYKGGSIAVVIHCENGYVVVPTYTSAEVYDKEDKLIRKFTAPARKKGDESAEIPAEKPEEKPHESFLKGPYESNHYANFLSAMRSRKTSDLHAPVLECHYSSALCHLGNISHVLGKKADPGDIQDKIKGNKEAMETLGRMSEHLKLNEVDLNVDKLTLGEFLKFDPKAEKFIGNKDADKLLTRDYRQPFAVPKIA